MIVMPSLVLELQRDALNPGVRVSDLLRRALVVARKLNLPEFEEWVSHELEGYPLGTLPPAYRVFEGEPRVWNPFQGWQPLVFADAAQKRAVCLQPTRQPVAEVEALVTQANGGGSVSSHFAPETARTLMEASGAPSPPVLQIDVATLVGLLDRVRNALLKWSLKLQEDGILGDDVGFSDEERARAGGTHYTVNNFFAPISGTQVQVASPESIQHLEARIDLDALRQFIAQLEQNQDALQLEPNQRTELEADLRTLHAQLASPRPKSSILVEGLRSIRMILEGAAGGALGNVAASLLPRLGEFLR